MNSMTDVKVKVKVKVNLLCLRKTFQESPIKLDALIKLYINITLNKSVFMQFELW
jgi:hypothetical protein